MADTLIPGILAYSSACCARTRTAISLCVLLSTGGTALAEDAYVLHRLSGPLSLDVLPADIAPMFQKESARYLESLLEPGTDWPLDRKLRRRNEWHECATDLEAVDQTARERLRAFLAFPRDEAEVKKLYRHHGRSGRGVLPWAVEACFNELVKAFREGDRDDVLQRAGHLAHFAIDVADPFRLTANDEGAETDNLIFGYVRGVHTEDSTHSAHERHIVGLLNRYGRQYASEVMVSTADYRPAREPVSASFAVMQISLADVDELLAADRETCDVLDIVDEESFDSGAGDYYAAIDNRCGSIWIKHIRLGAVFAANLIGGAWEAGGRPDLPSIDARTLTREDESGDENKSVEVGSGAYIGSRHSNIFHRPDCQFARQIAEDNLVTFGSAAEARRDHRRGCKACKP